MVMKPRDRIEYSAMADREPLALPDAKRVAVWIIVNIENWDIEKPMPRTVLPPPGNQVHIPDIPNWSWQEYGMRVGFWRFHEALVSRAVPVTMSVNGSVCVQYPRIAGAARDAGWEFLGHAYWQRPTHLIEDQREDIRRTIATIRDFTGSAPRGWMGPGLTETFETPDYLAEAGIEYVADYPMDDQPFDIRTEHGALTSIPYTVELNDIPMMLIQHHKAVEFYDRCMDSFERLDREGEGSARVMAIAVHPYISGTPFRIKYFEKVLDALASADGAVLWTGGQIVDWYRSAAGKPAKPAPSGE